MLFICLSLLHVCHTRHFLVVLLFLFDFSLSVLNTYVTRPLSRLALPPRLCFCLFYISHLLFHGLFCGAHLFSHFRLFTFVCSLPWLVSPVTLVCVFPCLVAGSSLLLVSSLPAFNFSCLYSWFLVFESVSWLSLFTCSLLDLFSMDYLPCTEPVSE